jgi:hypothetical protein
MAGFGGGLGGYVGGTPRIESVAPRELRPLYGRIGMSFPPVISLYAPGKPSPVAENFVNASRSMWAKLVPHADAVVVVGARPLAADPHIWQPLIESKADVWYIGGQHGDEYERFQQQLGRRLSPLGRRFNQGFDHLAARMRILS